MSGGFDIDTATLRDYAASAAKLRDRAAELRGMTEGAALGPGTFTATPGGRLADAAHAAILRRVSTFLDDAAARLTDGITTAIANAETYEQIDSWHAQAMSDFGNRADEALRWTA